MTSLTINMGFAKEYNKENLNKIYHVYVGNEYIGAVSDEKAIQEIIASKEKWQVSNSKVYPLMLAQLLK